MITIKSAGQIEKMRKAGALLCEVLTRLREEICPGVTTRHLDHLAEKLIRFHGYTPGVDAEGAEFSFGEVNLGPGAHTITVEIVGKNEKSEGTIISVKRWLLKPVGGQ